jgi:protein-tyrosine phosphatase
MSIKQNRKFAEELMELPVLVQINAGSLSHHFEGKKLCRMFAEGQAHLLGSDSHGMHQRPPNLGAGREIIKNRCGVEVLKEIDERGAKLIENEETH